MKKIWIIATKEFRSYFLSPVGYSVISSFLFITGYMFYQRLVFFVKQSVAGDRIGQQLQMSLNDAIVKPLYGTINVLFLFIIPVITMRLISEEKKTKTIELLLSSPVSAWQIVVGKYKGAMLLVMTALLCTFIYPLVLYMGGNPDMGQVFSMYIGLVLLSSVYVATGVLWSSVTENQIISGILTFVSLLFFWIVDWSTQNSSQYVADILYYISIMKHFEYFGQGVLSLNDAVYYMSLCSVLIYISYLLFDNVWNIKRVVKFIATILILVLINISTTLHDSRLDITRDKVNSLSDQTIKVLKSLEENVHFKAVLDPSTDGPVFKRAMDQYGYYTDMISYEIIDGSESGYKNNHISVTSNKRETQLDIISEEGITSAIVLVARQDIKKIYFTLGHGERIFNEKSDYSLVFARMKGYGYKVESLDILKSGSIPKDAGLLIVPAPANKFFAKEVALIKKYIKLGGNLIVLSDPSLPKSVSSPSNNVNLLVSDIGITFNNEVIIDPSSKLFGINQAIPVIADFDASNAITSMIKTPAIFPYSQDIEIKAGVSAICKSTASSWSEKNIDSDKISFDESKDKKGPFVVCAYICTEKEKGCVLAVGNSSFISDQYVDYGSNYDLFMNSVSFMLNDKYLVAIRPKNQANGYFSPNTSFVVGFFVVYAVPFIIMIAGIIFWYRRKRA